MIRLVHSRKASVDEADILECLAREAGPRVALAYRERFRACYGLLIDHPVIGSPRPALGRGVRMRVVEPYLVFYRHDRDAIDDIAVTQRNAFWRAGGSR